MALAGAGPAPDAVVLGTTTGGMLATERFLLPIHGQLVVDALGGAQPLVNRKSVV